MVLDCQQIGWEKMPAKTIKSPIHRGVARVPVIMQMEALECGAACLAMVMAGMERIWAYKASFASIISKVMMKQAFLMAMGSNIY